MIEYKRKREYKYVLEKNYVHWFPLGYNVALTSEFLFSAPGGGLVIKKGYAWDGPSGPARDSRCFMRGSLVHDAFYQLMREGSLPLAFRKKADEAMRKACIEDGMFRVRAWAAYLAVRMFGKKHAKPDLLMAP